MRERKITMKFISSVFTRCFKSLLPEELQFYPEECFPILPPEHFWKWHNKAFLVLYFLREMLVGLPSLGHFNPPFYNCTLEKRTRRGPIPSKISWAAMPWRVLTQKRSLIIAVQHFPPALHQPCTTSELPLTGKSPFSTFAVPMCCVTEHSAKLSFKERQKHNQSKAPHPASCGL